MLVSCFLPVMAHAASWTLNAASKSSTGSVQVGAVIKNMIQGTITVTYPDETPVTVHAIPNSGYEVSKVVINGVTTLDPIGNDFIVNGPGTQTVWVYFRLGTYKINSSVAGDFGGTVSPATITGLTPGAAITVPKIVTFTPSSALFTLSSITGIPTGATPAAYQTPAVPGPGETVTVTFPQYFIFNSNVNLVATFTSQSPIANAGPGQIGYVGHVTTLDGSASQLNGVTTTYAWSQTSGPATVVITPDANPARATFTPAVSGTYGFTLTLSPGGSTATTSVTVYNDATEVAMQCQSCHVTTGKAKIIKAYDDWATSKHNLNDVACANCHIGANTGNHPGSFSQATACNPCHNDGNPVNHPLAINGNPCLTCHNKHTLAASQSGAPHFNNITTGMYPASYVTQNFTCVDCHGVDSAINKKNREEWALTGHGNVNAPSWIAEDFKTLNDCVRCHTTTGFRAYSTAKVTAAWGVSTDKTKEVLICIGCHSDANTGTIRNVSLHKPYTDEPGFTSNDLSTSNICVNCHSGTNNGTSIQVKVGTANFASQPFVAPHGITSAGSIQGKSAFLFPGRTYAAYEDNSHRMAGVGNRMGTGTKGPCITCHVSGDAAHNKHSFKAISSASGTRTVEKFRTTSCTSCHGGSLSVAVLEGHRLDFDTAMSILKAQLQAKGFVYSNTAPYFSTTNWGSGQAGANVMGAAYNYRLFVEEHGAYAHNPSYAKQIIVDSIDAVYNNGVVTGDIAPALAALVSGGNISQAQADSLVTYKNSTSCNTCHGNPPAQIGAVNNHEIATDIGTCTTCHIYTGSGGLHHNDSHVDFQANIACGTCHKTAASAPQLATGTHGLHFTILQSTDEFVNCTKCHTYNGAMTAPHRDGTVQITAGCSTNLCHGSIATPTWGTNSSNNSCTKCHGTGTASVDATNRYVVAPNDIAATGTGKVSANAKTGAHQTHLRMLNGMSAIGTVDERCQGCHGALPTDSLHSNGTSTPSFTGIAANAGAMSPSFSGGSCSSTYCHDPAGTGGTLNSANRGTGVVPSWTNNGYIADGTLKTLSNCNTCHKVPGEVGFTSTVSHGSTTITGDCAGCHGHNGDSGGIVGQQHMDGIKYAFGGNETCSSCHGFPPMTQAEFDARGAGFIDGKVESYAGGAGHHSTHLLSTITAADGFTPCLPCHPSTIHAQGDHIVTRSNVQVNFVDDTGFRFDDSRAKRYNDVALTCSNISCHFKPTKPW